MALSRETGLLTSISDVRIMLSTGNKDSGQSMNLSRATTAPGGSQARLLPVSSIVWLALVVGSRVLGAEQQLNQLKRGGELDNEARTRKWRGERIASYWKMEERHRFHEREC